MKITQSIPLYVLLFIGHSTIAQVNQYCECNLVYGPKATLTVTINGVATSYLSSNPNVPTNIPVITLPFGQTIFTGPVQLGYSGLSCKKVVPVQPGYCNVPKTDLRISVGGGAGTSYTGNNAGFAIPNTTQGINGIHTGITTIIVYGNCQSNTTSHTGGAPCAIGAFKFNVVTAPALSANITLTKEC